MTGHADITGNRQLAARARDLAGQAAVDRRAWLCLGVALGTTRTTSAARQSLDGIPLADVRARAIDLLSELLGQIPG
ncbi:MAG: hypothetical protein ACLQDY_12805 [Streptosporangiaceae bacterium]